MKSKLLTRMGAVVLVLALAFTFASCSGNTTPNSENDLVIEMRNAGYGIEFMDDVIKAYNEIYPDVTVRVYDSVSLLNGEVETKIKTGEKYNATDLFITESIQVQNYVARGSEMNKNYNCILEPLDDVLNSPAYGEEMLLKDKIYGEFIDYNTFQKDGHVYGLPWYTGITGLIYRTDYFEACGLDAPRTTEELVAACKTLKDNGYTPFVWNKYGYWSYAYIVWWAQYEGLDEFKKFYSPVKDGEYTYEYFAQQGRYESLNVLDSLIRDTNKNSLTGSITFTHTEAQTKFMDDGKVAMVPGGDWVENEMRNTFDKGSVDIAMMRTPVISSIVDKLSTVKDEETLCKVIDAVDAGESSCGGVSAEDFARVEEARKMVYVNGFSSNLAIPSYSNAKEHAKNFIRVLLSDVGQQAFISKAGNFMPLNSDVAEREENVSNYNAFQKSVMEISNDLIGVSALYYEDPLFYLGKLNAFNQYTYPEIEIGGIGEDYVSGMDLYLNEVNWIKSRFDTYLVNSGIKK